MVQVSGAAMSAVQLFSKSNEHGTPVHVVEASRACLGAIDLDPASCSKANRVVGARFFFTQEDYSATDATLARDKGVGIRHDGLSALWGDTGAPSRVFLNPPGGSLKKTAEGLWVPSKSLPGKGTGRASSSTGVWWAKLCEEFAEGRVKEAIFIGFTLEILMRSQHYGVPIQMFARCYPKERLEFNPLDGQSDPGPGHANVIAFLSNEPALAFERFRAAFAPIGLCERGSADAR